MVGFLMDMYLPILKNTIGIRALGMFFISENSSRSLRIGYSDERIDSVNVFSIAEEDLLSFCFLAGKRGEP